MIHIINFATGAKFLRAQAIQNGIFEEYKQHLCEDIKIYSFNEESYLKILETSEHYLPLKKIYMQHPRGQGLWSWKSVLLEHVSHSDVDGINKDGDIILYVDSGACLKDIGVFNSFIKHIRENGCGFIPVAAYERADIVENWLKSVGKLPKGVKVDPTFPMCQWDTYNDFSRNKELGNKPQVCGGFQGYVLNTVNRCFITRLWHNPDLENILVGGTNNSDSVIEHRHDQAYLSYSVHTDNWGKDGNQMIKGVADFSEAFCLHRGNI